MIVCLDTNVVVQALAAGHSFRPIIDAWVNGGIPWALSTEILLEYEEVLTRLSGISTWRKLARLMDLVELTGGNILRVTPYFHFQIIPMDPDDNTFTDCAITANADYLVTEDHHFSELKKAGYKTQPIAPADFIRTIL